MTQSKKYSLRITQDNATWTAEIVRRKTAKESLVSKAQSGFASESDAQAWGETELKTFLQHQVERNKRHAKK
jgi:hypothetical protein